MATSPLVNPPANPAALATVLPANRVLAGTRAAPPRPRRFMNVRRPSRPLELVTDLCDFAISAPFREEASWFGASFVFIGFVFVFWFLMFLVGVSSLLVFFGSLAPMMGNQQVIDDEVSYFAA